MLLGRSEKTVGTRRKSVEEAANTASDSSPKPDNKCVEMLKRARVGERLTDMSLEE